MDDEKQLLVWNTDAVRDDVGAVRLVAKTPLSHMSTKQAAAVLGLSVWTVGDLYRLKLITGFKPGARRPRTDGKASSAALRLDAESVLRYKERQEKAAEGWQAGRG